MEEMEIVRIEKRDHPIRGIEWFITLEDGSFVGVRRPCNETIISLCEEIGKLSGVSIGQLITLSVSMKGSMADT